MIPHVPKVLDIEAVRMLRMRLVDEKDILGVTPCRCETDFVGNV